MPGSRFTRALLAVAAAGLAVRLVYVVGLSPDLRGLGDSAFYHGAANALADGDGFVDPATGRATALHPPLLPLLLAPASLLGADSYLAHRVVVCLLGAAAIAAIGVLARRVADARTGLIAAGMAAVYPAFVSADGAVMPESPFGLWVALALVAAYAYRDAPGWGRAALLGAAIGAAALTRGEGLLLLVLLVPLAVAGGLSRRRVGHAALALGACAVLILPWTVRNLATFERPVPLSTNEGTVLAGANCASTYGGRDIGGWDIACVRPGDETDESVAAARYRREGIDYATDHPGRLAPVAGARVLRTLNLYQPIRQAGNAEGRARWIEIAAIPAFYVLAVAGLAGAVVLRRRGVPLWPLGVAVGLALVVTVFGYGVPRFRQPADIALVVLAAVAVDAALRRRGGQPGRDGAAGAGSAIASPRSSTTTRGPTSRLSRSAGRSTP